ncbi:MAG: TipAS antibiotic-recognition domain-containing protein [Actinophytocola sp.]|uniref:TipAS antibiotic-recognition domain-containing protein n=1 Tax=Actinophytocola sp. TaxID=1872138 RepID=UPI003C743E04
MHRRWLRAERDRFARLARTVTRTIEELEEGDNVTQGRSMDHWFEGFDAAKQEELQEEARQRWGAEQVDAAGARVRDKSKEWWQSQGKQWAEQLDALLALIDAGHEPGDTEVLDVLDGHYRWLSSGHWTPDRESYTGLGDLYADDPRFRGNFDRTDPRLAEFLRTAMAAYAQARL